MKNLSQKSWLLYALITTVSWGIWGALIEFPEKNGFPATMGYIVWAVTMIPCALIALHFSGWNLNKNPKSIILGMLVGLTGAGGQIALFQALREGPAYIIFPIVSLYPILTILLSTIILKESASKKQGLGIGLALVAIFLLSYTSSSADTTNNYWWLILAASVFIAWGLQAFTMKFSNESMSAESIFFYMALSANLFSPIAYLMTENSSPINYGWSGAISAFFITFNLAFIVLNASDQYMTKVAVFLKKFVQAIKVCIHRRDNFTWALRFRTMRSLLLLCW